MDWEIIFGFMQVIGILIVVGVILFATYTKNKRSETKTWKQQRQERRKKKQSKKSF